MPRMPFQQFHENGLRQWVSPFGLFDDSFNFHISAGSLVNALGQNNGHNGMVTTLAGWDHHPIIEWQGFGPGTDWSFDHYGGTYKNGSLVIDKTLAYYHVADPSDHTHDGYVLLTAHSPIPNDLLFA